MDVKRYSAYGAELSQLQFTSSTGGTLLVRYLDKCGDSIPSSNDLPYENLTVATDGFSGLPNIPNYAVGVRVKASGQVFMWGKQPNGDDLGDYEDAIAFGDAMPTDRYVNLGLVKE